MSAAVESLALAGATEAADRRRRIVAIVGASSGNLVEWYDFYAYAFTSIYFAALEFSPSAFSCGRWVAGYSVGSPTPTAGASR
jgi:hypothetical protein